MQKMYENYDEIENDFADKAKKTSEKDLSKTLKKESEIADKITNSGILRKYAELAKLMFGMLRDYRKGTYRNVPWFTIGSIVFTLLYVLNPFDLVPDFIPGLGYIDDLSVLTLGLSFIETDLHNYVKWKSKDKEADE